MTLGGMKKEKSDSYVIVAYKGNKRIGKFRNEDGKIMKFRTKQEAATTANIESTQMESVGLDLRTEKSK